MVYSPQVGAVASLVTVWTFATTALILRLAARRMSKTPLWLDDFTCLAAYILGTTFNAWVLVWLRVGFGLRLDDITWLSRAEAISRARRALYFCEAFNSLSLGASKLAILALYWRLFSNTQIRYAIMYLGFLSFCWLVASTTVGMIRCVPAISFWEMSVHGECFDDERRIIYGESISHLILDSLILALPLFEVHKLRLNFWPKLGVITIFISGILTCLCAIGALVSVLRMPTGMELSFDMKNTVLFANAEVNLLIVTSCLPLLQPVVELLSKHLHSSTWSFWSCFPADASPPAPSSCAIPEQQQQQQQQQQQPTCRRRRFHHPANHSTTLFGLTMWSRLSSAATSKVNAGTGERAATSGNETVMTVLRNQSPQGVHVQLRREFRFISPPGPEPVLVRPKRRANHSIESRSVTDDPPEAGPLSVDEANIVDRMEKGEGDPVQELRHVAHPAVTKVGVELGTHLAEGEAIDKNDNALLVESEAAMVQGTKTVAESKGDSDGDVAAPTVKSQEETPGELSNDTSPPAVGVETLKEAEEGIS